MQFTVGPVEATGFGENATVPQGGIKTFSCSVDGNPKPNITGYKGSVVSGIPVLVGKSSKQEKVGATLVLQVTL